MGNHRVPPAKGWDVGARPRAGFVAAVVSCLLETSFIAGWFPAEPKGGYFLKRSAAVPVPPPPGCAQPLLSGPPIHTGALGARGPSEAQAATEAREASGRG